MQHTKGEWIYSKDSHGYSIYSDQQPQTIANVNNTSAGIADEEAEANAKLIAACPWLLGALKEAVDHAHVYDTNPVLVEFFKEAISRATL